MLLTADARGDQILEGLNEAGLLDESGRFHVDLLKLPHQGSDRNVSPDFFETVTADHYLFFGDGRHGDPPVETFKMIFQARRDDAFTLHLVYPAEQIGKDHERLLRLFNRERAAGRNFRIQVPAEGQRSVRIELG